MARHTEKVRGRLAAANNIKDQDDPAPAEEAPQPQPQGQRPARRPVDRDRCPRGWDEDIWHLTLWFEQCARADDIQLRAGRPVIYAEILHLVDLWKMREKVYPHYYEACERRELPASLAAKCWYHPRTDIRQRDLTVVEMVEVIMAEFWSRIWDEHALDYFRQYFAEFGRAAVKHWASLSAVEAINARPKVERQIMRRKRTGDTMTAASKEG